MSLFLIFLVLQLLEYSFCILHGQDAYIEEFPYLVSVRNLDQHVCSGSILNPRYVLTAAHCVCYNFSKDDTFTIQYGSTYIAQNLNNVMPVIERICHRQFYAHSPNYDAAILRLENDLPSGKWRPVELQSKGLFTYLLSYDGRIAGWGQNSEFHEQPSEQLQKLDVVVYNKWMCYWKIRNWNCFCSGAPAASSYAGACATDSGGPLIVKNRQVGIVSEQHPSDCESIENNRIIVYAKVDLFYDWIQENSNFLAD